MNKQLPRTLEQLGALVKRLEKDTRYMAWILASYQRQEKISETKLLEKLQSSHETLLRLALCITPNTESTEFHDHVGKISSYCTIDSSVIVNIIRQVESLDALSSQPNMDIKDGRVIEGPRLFAAARDNETTDADLSSSAGNPQNNDKDDNAA